MRRLRDRETWSLFDPVDVPGLLNTYGDEFGRQYLEYERIVEPVSTTRARDLWQVVCRAQEETGCPFIMYQDAINGTVPKS